MCGMVAYARNVGYAGQIPLELMIQHFPGKGRGGFRYESKPLPIEVAVKLLECADAVKEQIKRYIRRVKALADLIEGKTLIREEPVQEIWCQKEEPIQEIWADLEEDKPVSIIENFIKGVICNGEEIREGYEEYEEGGRVGILTPESSLSGELDREVKLWRTAVYSEASVLPGDNV